MSEAPYADESAFARLQRIGGKELVDGMIDIFLKNAPQRIATARKGERDGDLKVVEQAMHSLKSSAGNLGAVALQNLAAQIETLAEDGTWTGISQRLQAIEAAYERVEVQLKARREELTMKKVAVVEDNPDNLLLVQVLLGALYELREYPTGMEALEGFETEKPDLILLDISLPEMDGLAVLKHIRADVGLKRVPVIALTAHAMAGDREKYLSEGFDGYVTKPIEDENVLINTVKDLLDKAEDI